MQEDFIFPPPPDPRSPFRLHLAGTSYCDGNYRIELRERDLYFVFEYVESGRGQLQIDGVEYFPKAGELYRIPDSGRQAYWSGSEEPWIKHCFNVNGPLVPELLKLYSLENVRLIHNSPVRNVSPTDCSRRRKIGRNARFCGFYAISFPGNGVIFPSEYLECNEWKAGTWIGKSTSANYHPNDARNAAVHGPGPAISWSLPRRLRFLERLLPGIPPCTYRVSAHICFPHSSSQ